MKITTLISIGFATLLLALGYALNAAWLEVFLLLLIGCLWLAGYGRGWTWPASLSFSLFTGLAAWGVYQGLATGWLLGGLVAALVAWDLDHFAQRLRQAGHVAGEAELKQAHLRRLLIVAGLGLLLGGLALSFQIELNFGWALLLGLLVILGLSWVISRSQREND